jgi:hypothetical protein
MTGPMAGSMTGAGRAAVLVAALLPVACMSSFTLGRPPTGAGGDTGNVDAGGDSISGADRDGSSDRDGNCPASSSFLGLNPKRFTPSIVIALDHSSSMTNSRFGNNNGTRLSVVQSALEDRLMKYAQIIRFGYVEFPGVTAGHACANMNGCCVGKVIQPLNGSEGGIIAAIDQCGVGQSQSSGCLNSDSTPTAMALSAINDTYMSLGAGGAGGAGGSSISYTLLITDGEPSCAMGTSTMPGDACNQAGLEIGKLSKLLNVFTFVLGVGDIPGFSDSAGANSCLNDLAVAGGLSRADKSPFYYPASNESTLNSDLNTIVGQAACHLEIDDTVDPDRTQIEIITSGNNNMSSSATVPRDATNGWSYDRNSTTRIIFNGTSCQDFLNAAASTNQKVRAEGCVSR